MNLLGHPLHPAIVHFPIGLLISATMVDVAWVAGLRGDPHLAALLIAGGLAFGLLAMGAGMIDLIRLDERIVPYAMQHVCAVGLAWFGYAADLYLRKDSLWASTSSAPGTLAICISIASALVLALGGWLGGRLVYTFGANVAKS